MRAASRTSSAFIMDRDITVTRDVLLMVGGCSKGKNNNNIGNADYEDDEPCDTNVDDGMFFDDGDEDDHHDYEIMGGDSIFDDNRRPHGPPRVKRVVTRYNVPPGAARKFTKAWKRLESEVHKWEGSRAFALYRFLGDNTRFVGYAAFKPPKGGPPKKGRKVYEKYLEEIEDAGVSFTTEPIFPIRG
jgi:hypothetical protein